MRHLTDGELQALLDGELGQGDAAPMEGHVAVCQECQQRREVLRSAAELVSGALALVDRPAPSRARPMPHEAQVSERRRPARWYPWPRRWTALARAAVLLLVAASAAAALVPGSPVHEWLVELWMPGEVEVESPALPSPVLIPGGGGTAAVEVEPAAGMLRVSLRGFGAQTGVRVRLTEASGATVSVEGEGEDGSGEAAARFVVGPGSVDVLGGSGEEVTVELPRGATEAVLEVEGELAVRVVSGRLQILRPSAESLGADVVFRVGE